MYSDSDLPVEIAVQILEKAHPKQNSPQIAPKTFSLRYL